MAKFDVHELLKTDTYSFLKTNAHLGSNIIYLTLAGSRSYGTNLPTSDVDIRGIALNSPSEVVGFDKDFEQVEDRTTDTVIYSFNKIVKLLLACNPNTLELLGTRPCDVIYTNDIGKMLRNNRKAFLSQRVNDSLGGYANSQYNRLKHGLLSNNNSNDRKIAMMEQALQHSMSSFKSEHEYLGDIDISFKRMPADEFFKLYPMLNTDTNIRSEYMTVSMRCENIPITDLKTILDRIQNINSDYNKVNKEFSRKKIEGRLAKHMMHLVRLYLMGIDLNEKGQIITYRGGDDHELLMKIRNGEYLTADGKNVVPEFWDLLEGVKGRYDYAVKHTILPERPNIKRVSDIVRQVNEGVILRNN